MVILTEATVQHRTVTVKIPDGVFFEATKLSLAAQVKHCEIEGMSLTVAESVLALREALKLTQGELSRRAGFSRGAGAYISKIERGDNALSDRETHAKLARGFGLTPLRFDLYLRGELSLEEAISLVRLREQSEPPEPEEQPEAPAPDEDEDPFSVALLWALDRDRHTMRDLDAVRAALRTTARMAAPGTDLIEAARAWLDAAARLRRAGKPVTIETLLLEVTVGSKTAAVSASAKALQEDTDAEWQARLDARKKP